MLTFYEDTWAYARLERDAARVWILLLIRVEKRKLGRGLGSMLMHRILADADREQVTLKLQVPGHTYKKEMTAEQLTEWYRQLGFYTSGKWLVRRPRKPVLEGTHAL